MEPQNSNRKYTNDEKRQLVANLDIEVAHRTRQIETWLADRLENFTMHQEGHVLRIPKQVRSMTMREFGEKYKGNVQAALRGFQKDRFIAAGGDANLGEIDKSMRKRKWVASQEAEAEASGSGSKETESSRASKNARIATVSPKKKAGSSTGPGTAQRARLLAAANKTPGASRTMGRAAASPSPQKPRLPFYNNATSTYGSRPPSRPTSPVKYPVPKPSLQQHRVPSSSTFNPTLPPKTPAYPATRLPRRDESMLSVNGSPIANPYELGIGWFKSLGDIASDDEGGNEGHEGANSLGEPRTLKRSNSSIIIRRDPSVAFPSTMNGFHSRTNSQASILTSSSQPPSSSSSRESTQPLYSHSQPHAPAQSIYPSDIPISHSQPALDRTQTYSNPDLTPKPFPTHTRSFSAMVAIPTKDGHLLEFDPLQTSPGALDALEGITDSAKKQARLEMGRLVQAAVDKWKIG